MADHLLDPERLDEGKRAWNDHDILEIMGRRWSPRIFQERDVESEKLLRCLEAARWAPSSFNEQPWRFLVAMRDGPAEYERMLSCFTEKNQRWARTAPVLLISLHKKTFTKNGKPARTAAHDLGLAVMSLVLQATHEGLSVRQAEGIDVERIRTLYHVPEDFEVMAGIAIGYRGIATDLPDDMREAELRPRNRRRLNETVFQEEWEHPADLVR